MNIGNIKYSDIANGEGVRTTLFVSGCTHCCAECFQPETWNFSYGEEFTEETAEQVMESLEAPWVEGLTILGGEPMEPQNQAALAPFLQKVRRRFPSKTIWLYTGDTWEELQHAPRKTTDTAAILSCLDVLVDGRYERDRKDITLRFRGSSNQRVIDVPATLSAGEVVLWHDDPLFATHRMP